MLFKILVIVGPTASGKTSLSIRLAKKFDGEIISADSRQVYTGLDIGSGKVTKREMSGIPHHMLDVANPKRQMSVVRYQALAYKAIDGILSRGKLPIIVGGTGHYVDAITKGLIIPEVKPNTKLRMQLSKLTNAQMFKRLELLDSTRAKSIDRHNPRRLVRAIEIATALGKVPELIAKPRYSPSVIGLKVESKKLKVKISQRLKQRMKMGMVKEVRDLHNKRKISWKRLEQLGLEYKYVALYLQNKITKQEMLDKIQLESEKYAKRQMTWFKRDKDIKWHNDGVKAVLPFLASLPGLRGKVKLPSQLS